MADPATDAPDPSAALSAGPSTPPDVCPLLELARTGDEGVRGPDPANRCAAFAPARALAVTQQRLVCLGPAHVDCPLFVRVGRRTRGGGGRGGRSTPIPGLVPVPHAPIMPTSSGEPTGDADQPGPSTAVVSGGPADLAPEPTTPSEPTTPPGTAARPVPIAPMLRSTGARQARPGSRPIPTIVAGGILVAALVVAFAFATIRGGLALPGGGPGASDVAATSMAPSPTPEPTVEPTPSPSPTPEPTATPIPTSEPAVTSTPAASLPPAYVGLEPCPDRPDCYLYRIRSGDTLTAIAGRFGITLKTLRAANPEIEDPSLIHVGDVIRIPLPTS